MNENKLRQQPVVTAKSQNTDLVMLDQQLALSAYLGALLNPAPVDSPASTLDEMPPEDSMHAVEATQPVATPEPAVVQTAPPVVAVETVEATENICQALEPPSPPTSPYPDWAAESFQCLLFTVAGVNLALPLVKLSGVLPWDDTAVTEMPNHQPWFLGLREHLNHKVKLIDVANVVLPADRYARLPPPDCGRLGKVILIDEGRWGLAVDSVAEVVTLSVDAVKWRTQAGRRPWLAGTVIEQMCVLIDTEAFAQMLGTQGPDRS